MSRIDILVSSEIKRTPRVMQLEGMFDVPAQEKLAHQWHGDLPIEEKSWNVGLIVGPSGAGKSSIARQLFGERKPMKWKSSSVVDDFDKELSMDDISATCSAVGFNTIPSWMKPFSVLSTGERFRVELARHLLSDEDPIVVDEFTSVVDRQIAHIGCVAVSKHVRKRARRFIAVTCHYDVCDWLQPDWVLEPATMTFQWRSVQRRPAIDIEISRVDHKAWQIFAPYHYLTNELHRSAACYVLFVHGEPAAFAGVLHRPHPTAHDIKGISRVVTHPDYQGMGLAFVLMDFLGSAYRAMGYRFRNYPAHPSFVRAHDRSDKWAMTKKPGTFSPTPGRTSRLKSLATSHYGGDQRKRWAVGGRPCAVFEYVGPAIDIETAKALTQV